jgi:NAD+ synthase (glutamine-hydrolysing)
MRLIKLGIANINTTVGATASNTAALIDAATAMARDDVAVACFPEQVIGGYPPEDLVQWRAFLEAQRSELQRFAEATSDSPLVSVVGLLVPIGGQIFNVAAVVHSGAVLGFVPKEKLPSYNVFYEGRTPGRHRLRLRVRSARGRGMRGRLVTRRTHAETLLLRR